MKKADSLRQHLQTSIPELQRNPDKLLVFVDAGNVRCTAEHGFSFEYGYDLNIIITDFSASTDAVIISVLGWLRTNQNELLANLQNGGQAFTFEADIQSNNSVDLSLVLPLTERVIVKAQSENSYNVDHPQEPQLTDQLDAGHFVIMDSQDNILVEWDSTPPTGADIETPHPGPTGNQHSWLDSVQDGGTIQADE